MKLKLMKEEILTPDNVTERKELTSMVFNDYVDYLITPRANSIGLLFPLCSGWSRSWKSHSQPILDATRTISALHQTDNIDEFQSKHRRVNPGNFDYNLKLAN